MSERRKESSAPDRVVVADVSAGRKLGDAGGFTARWGVTGAVDPEDGSPIVRPEDEIQLDPRQLRIHDLDQKTPDGIPDRRVQLQVVNDFAAEYSDARPGDAPYGQDESFTAVNRSTRFADGQGRVALPSSLERNVDSEDGRYARALTLHELPLEGPASVLGKPDSGGGAAALPPPPGVVLLDAGSTNGTGGSVTRKEPGVAVQGLTINGAAARAAAEGAIAAGGNTQDVRDAALAAAFGRSPPPLRQKDPPAPSAKEPEPLPPEQVKIGPVQRPAGYVVGEKHGRPKVGLLGTFFTPTSGEPMFLGREDTPIGTLPARRDFQVATDEDRRGAFLIVDDDVSDVPEPQGALIKGWIAHDASLAGQDTALPGETHKLRPVIKIDAAQVPPASEPPPYWEPERKKPEEEPGTTTQRPQPTGQPIPPTSGPAEGNGRPRPPGPLPPPVLREPIGAVGDDAIVQPTQRTTTGALAQPVANPQAQGRDFTRPGVPCPNATGGVVLEGPRAMSGGTTGRPPDAPVVSTGHPAVVHTGTQLLIGPAQVVGGGIGAAFGPLGGAGGAAGGAAGVAPLTSKDLAQGPGALALQDRFVDHQGRVVPARGLDPVADPRIPIDELDEAIPLSAFPSLRRGIVRIRRENARKREEARKFREAAKISGVERRRAQNERDLRLNLQAIDRTLAEARARRAAAEAKTPKDQKAIDRANRDLHRLGQQRSAEQDRAQRQRDRLDRSQQRLEADRRRAARRQAAKQEQQQRRERRARDPKAPRGGIPVETTPSPVSDAAAANSGFIGEEEARARGAAAQIEDADQQRSLRTNEQLSDEGRAALGLPPLPREASILGSVGIAGGAGGFGAYNLLTTPTPIFGEPGGPATVQAQLTLLSTQMRGVLAVLNGAFGGPAYLQSNLAVQHENTPGNPPAPSTIASKWTAGPGERLQLGRQDNTLEVRSTVVAAGGGTVDARAGAIVNVVRETDDAGGKVRDRRPGVLVEERSASGRGSGAEAVATQDQTGAGWSSTYDGRTRHRLPDGSFWEEVHEDDNSVSKRKHVPTSTGSQLRGGTTLDEEGTLTSVDVDGNEQTQIGPGVGFTALAEASAIELAAEKDRTLVYKDDATGHISRVDPEGNVVDLEGGSGLRISDYPRSVDAVGYAASPGDDSADFGAWGKANIFTDSTGYASPVFGQESQNGRWGSYCQVKRVMDGDNLDTSLLFDAGPATLGDLSDGITLWTKCFGQDNGGTASPFDLGDSMTVKLTAFDPSDGTTEISKTRTIEDADDADYEALILNASDLAGVFEIGDQIRLRIDVGFVSVDSPEYYGVCRIGLLDAH